LGERAAFWAVAREQISCRKSGARRSHVRLPLRGGGRMTAEIAVLNKFGVALAADSAITVEHFHEGELKTKVYNTANKLFSLSKYDPVGIMFYNTVTLGGVPWETIIKAYRSELKDTHFDTVSQHANNFLSWLDSKPYVFSESHNAEIIERNLFREFGRLVVGCKNRKQFEAAVDKKLAALEKLDTIAQFSDSFADDICKEYDVQINSALKYMIQKASWVPGLKAKLKRIAGLSFTRKTLLSGYSGLVIAGFGAKESLPSLEEYYVDSIVCGKIKYWLNRRYNIDEKNESEVVPLADSEAMKTLIDGVSPTFLKESWMGALKLIVSVPETIVSTIVELSDEKKKEYLQAARQEVPNMFKKFADSMTEFRDRTYTRPIKQSIASLPISELGTVAEALLGASQVLKKVNPDLETIGGPVDVAVISKGDGFIWIKRKHYFSDALNPTYKLRYLSV
jgi:hypothetical protein